MSAHVELVRLRKAVLDICARHPDDKWKTALLNAVRHSDNVVHRKGDVWRHESEHTANILFQPMSVVEVCTMIGEDGAEILMLAMDDKGEHWTEEELQASGWTREERSFGLPRARDLRGLQIGSARVMCPTNRRAADRGVIWIVRCGCGRSIERSNRMIRQAQKRGGVLACPNCTRKIQSAAVRAQGTTTT